MLSRRTHADNNNSRRSCAAADEGSRHLRCLLLRVVNAMGLHTGSSPSCGSRTCTLRKPLRPRPAPLYTIFAFFARTLWKSSRWFSWFPSRLERRGPKISLLTTRRTGAIAPVAGEAIPVMERAPGINPFPGNTLRPEIASRRPPRCVFLPPLRDRCCRAGVGWFGVSLFQNLGSFGHRCKRPFLDRLTRTDTHLRLVDFVEKLLPPPLGLPQRGRD